MEKLGFETKRYSSAKECPCGKSNKDNKFSPFKGETAYGKCHSCNKVFFPPTQADSNAPIVDRKQKYIDFEQVSHSQTFFEKDPFFLHFQKIVGDAQKANDHLLSMNVGSRNGATVFWMVDQFGRVCQPKSFVYDWEGKRKSIVPETTFNAEGDYYPCLFNASGLIDNKTIVLVESEKSACIASYFFPDYTWIATGGASGLSQDKAFCLKDKTVIVMFDADVAGREGAERSVKVLTANNCKVKAMELAPDRLDGYDIADLISENRDNIDEAVFAVGKLIQAAINTATGIDAMEAGIVDVNEEEMVYRYLNDIKDRGETSHFFELDEAFKWKRGLVYTYTGYAGTGKSEVNLFLAFLKALKDGWRFIVFVPESMSSNEAGYMTVEEIYDTLAHMYHGKPVDIKDIGGQTEAQYREAIKWIKNHFTIMYPNGGFANQRQLIDQAKYILNTRGKHDAVIIDPWNNVASLQDKNELLDDYLRRMIMEAKLFAVNNRLSWVYVTHPSKPVMLKDGSLPPADMYSIRGGMSFANGSDFVIIIERPYFFLGEATDERTGQTVQGRNHPLVHFITRKVKNQKLLGCRPNTVPIYFNKYHNRYENEVGISPLDQAYSKQAALYQGPPKSPVDKNRGTDFTITLPVKEVQETFDWSRIEKDAEEEEFDMPF